MTPKAGALLEVDGLHRSGLQPASFSLAAGECIAVHGHSGSGKTLLLRALADLDPNRGVVRLEGRDRATIPAPTWRQRVGYLPAEPGWWADTIGEHFIDWESAAVVAAQLGLPHEARGWPLTRPSTGERLRLALVRALAESPQVLMLDEPTAALDAGSVAAVEALLRQRVADGLAVLWVSHDPAQAARVGHRHLLVEAGRVREAGRDREAGWDREAEPQ